LGNRLSKIYTRTGDDGTTGLGSGERVSKDDLRVEAYGTVDELNSAIGLVVAAGLPPDIGEILTEVQQRLFDLGGELCIPGTQLIDAESIADLENHLDRLNADLPALKDFVLPGGARPAAICHMARAICRRTERRAITLSRDGEVNPDALRFLNRLSDLLFVIARTINQRAEHAETLWSGSSRSTN
jgi:cob(I)alamin adenosyltransferase